VFPFQKRLVFSSAGKSTRNPNATAVPSVPKGDGAPENENLTAFIYTYKLLAIIQKFFCRTFYEKATYSGRCSAPR
jgi:hypothetical protein